MLACTLIALLPELGRMSRKQVAALVGVAPYAFESGKLKGPVHLGRSCLVRHVLYMAAMSASNWNPGSNHSTIASRPPERSRRSSSWR